MVNQNGYILINSYDFVNTLFYGSILLGNILIKGQVREREPDLQTLILFLVSSTSFFYLYSQFSVVFNLNGPKEHSDHSDEFISEEVLRKAMENADDEASLFIRDEEFNQVNI